MAMRLGSQTNSLTNHLYSGAKMPTPTVGMGATLLGWTDRNPATIVQVIFGGLGSGPTEVVVQEDRATRTDDNGMSEIQSYTYEANPRATKRFFTKRTNGSWIEKGAKIKDGAGLMIGEREKYHDFSF